MIKRKAKYVKPMSEVILAFADCILVDLSKTVNGPNYGGKGNGGGGSALNSKESLNWDLWELDDEEAE